MSASASPLLERRREQMFPVLNQTQIAIARRFGGEPVRFEPNQLVFDFGQSVEPAYLVPSGSIKAERRDGLRGDSDITTLRPGELTGEICQRARPMRGDVA